MNLKTFSFIFARGGSKGLPRKNVKNLINKPLLAYSIDMAKSIEEIDKIFVSTDSPEIMDVANKYGAEVIIRPEELSSDNAPEWFAWQHAIYWVYERHGFFDRFLSLPCTAPLRIKEDVKNTINALDEDSDIVITISEARRSPWFNMVVLDKDNYANLVIKDNNPIHRRQDSLPSYDMTTVAYFSRPEFILSNSTIWDGRVRATVIPKERSIDIDDALDFFIAECFIKKSHLNND